MRLTAISRRLPVGPNSQPQREFFFSKDHCQPGLNRGIWTSISCNFPCVVGPRFGLEDGLIDTIEKYAFVYRDSDLLIPNPNPVYELEDWYQQLSILHVRQPEIACSHSIPKNLNELTEVQRKLLLTWQPF